MAIAAVIFDVDGTLVDTNGVHVEAWQQALARYGYRVPAERLAPEMGKGGGFREMATGRSSSSGPPRARMTERSITLRNSRILPGQP